jgi:hypothetical protein
MSFASNQHHELIIFQVGEVCCGVGGGSSDIVSSSRRGAII